MSQLILTATRAVLSVPSCHSIVVILADSICFKMVLKVLCIICKQRKQLYIYIITRTSTTSKFTTDYCLPSYRWNLIYLYNSTCNYLRNQTTRLLFMNYLLLTYIQIKQLKDCAIFHVLNIIQTLHHHQSLQLWSTIWPMRTLICIPVLCSYVSI